MSDVQVVQCPICKEPYETYAFYAGNQSVCPDCKRKAHEKSNKWRELR